MDNEHIISQLKKDPDQEHLLLYINEFLVELESDLEAKYEEPEKSKSVLFNCEKILKSFLIYGIFKDQEIYLLFLQKIENSRLVFSSRK